MASVSASPSPIRRRLEVRKKKARFAAVGERRRSRIGRRSTVRLVEDARAEQ